MGRLGLAVLLGLAAFRLERLVTADMILARPRTVALAHLPRPLASGLSCPACVGVWASAAAVGLAWAVGWLTGGWPVVLWVAAVAAVQLVVSSVERLAGAETEILHRRLGRG